MKQSRSEGHLKFSVKKMQNFLQPKNFAEEHYLDEEAEYQQNTKSQYGNQHTSSKSHIKPRAKLTYSLRERVDTVVSASRKLNILDKVDSESTKKSMAKISYTSTLPPIKTGERELFNQLTKIKHQLNVYSEKNIKGKKEVHKLQASLSQMKEKIRLYEGTLYPDTHKMNEQIEKAEQKKIYKQYETDVLTYMRDNLKEISITLQKKLLEKKQLQKQTKQKLQSLQSSLEQCNYQLSHSITTTQRVHTMQDSSTTHFLQSTELAAEKISHEHRAYLLKHQYDQKEQFEKERYLQQNNLKIHKENLQKYQIQWVFGKIVDSLMLKFRVQYGKYDKAEKLMKMYSVRKYKDHDKSLEDSQKSLKESSLRLSNNSFAKNILVNEEFAVSRAYRDSFSVREELYTKIQQYQKRIKELEKKHEQLFKKWTEKSLNDEVTGGEKCEKQNFETQFKELYARQKKNNEDAQLSQKIKMWIRKQQEKLDVKISKKSTVAQYLKGIMEYVTQEAKKVQFFPPLPIKKPASPTKNLTLTHKKSLIEKGLKSKIIKK